MKVILLLFPFFLSLQFVNAFFIPAPMFSATTQTASMTKTYFLKGNSFVVQSRGQNRISITPGRSHCIRMGLFGLGAPEIAVIIVVAAFVLGPDKLASLAKDAGRMAGELKEVPKEFQAGVSEGEAEMKKMIKESKTEELKDAEISD